MEARHCLRLSRYSLASSADVQTGARTCPAYTFGMWLDDVTMFGRIVLVPVDPPKHGLGYWVS